MLFHDYFTTGLKSENASEIEKLNNGMQTFVYGSGHNAEEVVKILREHGVEPCKCICSDEFWVEGAKCSGVDVVSRSIFERSNYVSNSNIVIAFDGATSEFISGLQKLTKGRVTFLYYNISLPTAKISQEWVKEHIRELDISYDCLADELSRASFLAYFRAKANCIKVANVPTLRSLWKENEYINTLLDKCEIEHMDGVVIDCGAYNGDTAELLYKTFPQCSMLCAIEPDSENFNKLEKKSKTIPVLLPIRKGTWSFSGTLKFNARSNPGSNFCDTGEANDEVEVTTIDELMKSEEKVSFIKIDVEGCELETLYGAKRTIVKHMPMLAICAYHRYDDLVDLPSYINYLSNQNTIWRYDLYLRHHSFSMSDLILYAIPVRR